MEVIWVFASRSLQLTPLSSTSSMAPNESIFKLGNVHNISPTGRDCLYADTGVRRPIFDSSFLCKRCLVPASVSIVAKTKRK